MAALSYTSRTHNHDAAHAKICWGAKQQTQSKKHANTHVAPSPVEHNRKTQVVTLVRATCMCMRMCHMWLGAFLFRLAHPPFVSASSVGNVRLFAYAARDAKRWRRVSDDDGRRISCMANVIMCLRARVLVCVCMWSPRPNAQKHNQTTHPTPQQPPPT